MGLDNGSDNGLALVTHEEELNKKESLTIDQVVDKIYQGPTIKLFLVFWTAVAVMYVTAAETYITVFTGRIPYTEWTCVSETCEGLYEAANISDSFYSEKSMCDNELVAGTDFNWTSTRTTFSIDWGIYCGTESKLSLASSLFFIGALLGLLTSTAIFDKFGRRNGAIVGSVISASATLAGVWAPNYEVMLAIRIVQGYGQYMSFTGVYCWILEFAPSHLRCNINTITLFAWNLGFLLMVGLAYFITTWQYIFLAAAVINFVCIISLCIYPISPRFALVQGRDEAAKEILQSYSRICGNEMSMESVDLVYKDRVQNFWEQIKDFKTHPAMLKRTLLGCICWFMCGALFYGFSFGWSKIGSNIYTAYCFAAVGNTIGFAVLTPTCNLIGRKKSGLVFFGIVVLANLLAMPDVSFSDKWTLNYIACLIGSIAVLAAFLLMYLFTSELAPTSHRGMIMSLSSSCARLGSFAGPYISLLYKVTDRRVTAGVFGGMALIGVAVVFFLPDTTGVRIPEVPGDLTSGTEYQKVENGTQAPDHDEEA